MAEYLAALAQYHTNREWYEAQTYAVPFPSFLEWLYLTRPTHDR